MSVRVAPLTGPDIEKALPALARLRIAVFREWPYLYEGTLDYEQDYLAHFSRACDGIIVAATDGDEIVGVATGAPLTGHTQEFVPLFREHGFDPETIFYCGESVLLPSYRGRGIGNAFFDHREVHARSLTTPAGTPYTHITFCGVVRDADDPRKPPDYVPLDGFWRKRGYEKVDGLLGSYSWREIGATEETEKAMQFWMRAL